MLVPQRMHPILVSQPIGEKAASLSTNFALVGACPWMRTKLTPFFQYTSTSGGGKFESVVIGVDAVITVGGRGAGLIITLDHRIWNVRSFECFQSFGARVEAYRVRSNGARRTNLGNDNVGESQLHYADKVPRSHRSVASPRPLRISRPAVVRKLLP